MDTLYYKQTLAAITELCRKAKLKAGNIVVVGCSTSEVVGSKIGTNSNPELPVLSLHGMLLGMPTRIGSSQNQYSFRIARRNIGQVGHLPNINGIAEEDSKIFSPLYQ